MLIETPVQTLRTFAPTTWDKDVASAWQFALDRREPVFAPSPVYADDRGWSLMNQMQGVMEAAGQINFSVQYPGVVKAWHRHYRQTDFWLCLNGHIKVGVYNGEEDRAWMLVIGEKRPGIMVIPPPLWHGAATVGHEPAGLLYYVSRAYDPKAPDEERREFDSVAGFPWGVCHR